MEDEQAEQARAGPVLTTDKPCHSAGCQRRVPTAGPSRCARCETKSRARARREDAAVGAIMLSLVSVNSVIELASRHRRWALPLGLVLVPSVILAARRQEVMKAKDREEGV